jgi:hypothetical protein
MRPTVKDTMLVVLFVFVNAAMYVLEAWQSSISSISTTVGSDQGLLLH